MAAHVALLEEERSILRAKHKALEDERDNLVDQRDCAMDLFDGAKRERDEAREALQKVASMAHGNADKTVCLIMLSGIQRVVTEALKSQEAAR